VYQLEVVRWKRYGHDRLYANLPDGTAAGWADCKTGAITVLQAEYRDAVTAILTQHLPGIVPAPASRNPDALRLPPLTPGDDLASNAPGDALRTQVAAAGVNPLVRLMPGCCGVRSTVTPGVRG
jgi:hypothetical protein